MIDFVAIVEELRPGLEALNAKSASPLPVNQRQLVLDCALNAAAQALLVIERAADQAPSIGTSYAIRILAWQIVERVSHESRNSMFLRESMLASAQDASPIGASQ